MSFSLWVTGDEAPSLDVVEVFRYGEAGVEGLLVDAELLRAPLAQREDVVRPPVGSVPRFGNVALHVLDELRIELDVLLQLGLELGILGLDLFQPGQLGVSVL